jgi:anti-sigma regulatory factor (Ser/Thr protein kinase)
MHWSFQSHDADGAHRARCSLLSHLQKHASDDSDVAAAALVFGELVGNVVRHAPGPIAVDFCWKGNAAILRVVDQGPGYDWSGRRRLPDPYSEFGRGLYIVAKIARSLQVRRLPGRGTEAIAHLPVSPRAERT